MSDHTILQNLATLADATRARLLLVLERHELTVSEVCVVVQLPQSTVSRHLRILSDDGWLSSRADGASRYYRLSSALPAGARGLWDAIREPLAEAAESAQDAGRARAVVARRRTRSQEFFSTAAGEWDAVRAELFGPSPELPALLALLEPTWEVGDLGCGTGRLAQAVAPYVRRVIAVDESPDMLAAARARLGAAVESEVEGTPAEDAEGRGHVELREGRLEALPLAAASLDVALLALVLHYVADPAQALAEARRVLRPAGRVLVVDMLAHGRTDYRERMGHLWPGFERSQVEAWLTEAGFDGIRYRALPVDPEAKGPLLFAAAARVGTAESARA